MRLRRFPGTVASWIRAARLSLTAASSIDRLLTVLILLNLTVYALYAEAFKQNHFWLHADTTLSVDYRVPAEPAQAIATGAIFDEPCEIGNESDGCSEDSEAVAQLRTRQLPRSATELLKKHPFSSAYHLLKSLSVRGDDAAVVSIVQNQQDVFDEHSLSRFAVIWYLRRAIEYSLHAREQDALNAYRQFTAIVRVLPARGDWLSRPGVDATDLPVLSDLFCGAGDRLNRDICDIGIVKAIAGRFSFYGGVDSYQVAESLVDGIDDFGAAYSELPATLKSEALVDYLHLWDAAPGSHVAPSVALNDAQSQAWSYAQGVGLLQTARLIPGSICLPVLEEAAGAFQKTTEFEVERSYFSAPAERRLQDIRENGDALCSSGR